MAVTYDELINGDDAFVKRIERAYIEHHGRPPGITDQAHNIWRLLREGWSIENVIHDIKGEPLDPTQGVPEELDPRPNPPVPPMGVDLHAWPRRGMSHAVSLLDARWDYEGFAWLLGSYFGGRGLTRVNAVNASWRETSPHYIWPFTRLPDGRFDLYAWNAEYFDRRLPRYIETMNRYGVVPIFTMLDLYSWSFRKDVSADHHQDLDWPRHNVNGVRWGGPTRQEDDATLRALPDTWLTAFIVKFVHAARRAGVFAIEPFNEGPEKSVHLKIADIVKQIDPSIRVQVNRNEDTPGQYVNMKVGRGTVDQIAFHGWKTLGFLDRDFPDHYKNAKGQIITPTLPRTFRQFFNRRAHDGRKLTVDFTRVCISSDGSRRAGSDPIHTYDYDALKQVFAFGAQKGCSLEHQSRSKMTPGARLDMVEKDFAREMAAL